MKIFNLLFFLNSICQTLIIKPYKIQKIPLQIFNKNIEPLDKNNFFINLNNKKASIFYYLINKKASIFYYLINKKASIFYYLINKKASILKLIRYKNILPTILLNLTGGIFINKNMLFNPLFILSIINSVLIMAGSMIINDLYDIKIDRENHKNRPLITGEITVKEAIFYTFFIINLVEFLNLYFFPKNLQYIIHFSIIFINIYTPILKKIPIIKNISCALLVSYSIYYSGITVSNVPIFLNKNYFLFLITISFIFFGSLYNELLLDMSDYIGDKNNNIKTLPVLIGNEKSWYIADNLLNINFLIIIFFINYLYNIYYGGILLILFNSLKKELFKIKKNNYTKDIILGTIDKSSLKLYGILIYMIALSFL